MKSLGFGQTLGIVAATALLAGCGGSQPPIGAPGALPQSRAIATHAEHGRSTTMQDIKTQNLLYVADYSVGVIVYTYLPSHMKYVGLLSGPSYPRGECVDKAQNVWVTNGDYSILKYAHGGTNPIAILSDPIAIPEGCAVDPTTGNLAAVGAGENGIGQVAVYKKGRGRPAIYHDPSFGDMFSCGYDNNGNLFIDGMVVRGSLRFTELPKGSGTFNSITLDQSFFGEWGGGVQWDGRYVVVGDLLKAVVYQFDIDGSAGTEVSSTPLDGSGTVSEFFIDGGRIIAPSSFPARAGFVKIYNYPAGGSAEKTLHNFSSPDGVVVSLGRR